MGGMKEKAINLLEEYGDLVDIYYTQFLEVSFFLKVPASYPMVLAFLKKKIPNYIVKSIINLFLLRLTQSVYYFSKVAAFYKFNKFLKKNN